MTSKNLKLWLLAALTASGLVLSGCGGDQATKDENLDNPGLDAGAGSGSTSGIDTSRLNDRGLKGVDQDDRAMFADPNNPLSTRVIYFDFDSDVVRSDYTAVLKAHAAYALKRGKTIRLEGHTDERGTREYNVALSERRAQSVQRVLMLEGMSQDGLPTLAFGEERPASLGHDESAWGQNRRVELIYVQ